ncbi:hypothetical protein INS49_004492 [Diaporthe citri]|uniref:uncharacterized protein n=1 Tax=Diaporthe citri TaxID=83186 RepID=UPI001C7E441C|nr:uncharacterized protein INS49_004492 [Diaporthe citri]KAG6354475.1 hypothetical protein INS49_004492 [Diaporthe citri]
MRDEAHAILLNNVTPLFFCIYASLVASFGTRICLKVHWALFDRRADVPPSVFEVPAGTRNVFPAANFNRDVTTNWWDTEVLDDHDAEASSELAVSLKNASFIVLDQEFYQLLENDEGDISATVEKNLRIPFWPFVSQMPWVWRVNLNESTPTTEKVYPLPPLTLANGAYYHNGGIYWAQGGNYTTPGGIVRMDPVTLQTDVVLNNFMGHRFNSPNDVVVTRSGIAYFTDGYYGFDNFNDTLRPELANGLWRWDMRTGDLRMVAGAAGRPFVNPNGVALNLAEDRIYVTNRGNASDNPAGGRTIHEFELHDEGSGVPVRGGDVFAYADAGFPDGVKLDGDGIVYGGVTGGVSVYGPTGKQLGLIKVSDDDVAVNMVWADDWLYIAGRDYLYRVRLNARGVQTF